LRRYQRDDWSDPAAAHRENCATLGIACRNLSLARTQNTWNELIALLAQNFRLQQLFYQGQRNTHVLVAENLHALDNVNAMHTREIEKDGD
jgi:hypothetical protein